MKQSRLDPAFRPSPMSRLVRRAVSVTVVAVVIASMFAGAASAQAPDEDSVTSQDVFAFPSSAPYLQPRIEVHSGPSGQSPAGALSYFFGTPGYNETVPSAAVTCLAVSGNRAVIGGFGLRTQSGYSYSAIPPFHPPPPANFGFYLFVVDNGPAGTVPFTGPDQIAFEPGSTTPPTDCAAVVWPDLTLLAQGNIVVHDAPALPTFKDQCKNGGCKNYAPLFKNQGQCVVFVERGPRSSGRRERH
jgi:hypothetical protein